MKQKLEETKAKLKSNSKDAHFAESLISDLASLYGQLAHQPTITHHEVKDVEDTVGGNTFEINIMKDGTAIYHVYGGYTIIADPRARSLNMAIKMVHDCMKNGGDEDSMTLADAAGHILSIPMFVFSDEALTYELATISLKWLAKLQDEGLSTDVADEDPNAITELQDDVNMRDILKDALL